MIDIHKERIKTKLLLWNTPGFSQFIEDLAQQMGPEMGISLQVNALRNIYKAKLVNLENKGKLKQLKLL